MSLSIPIEVCFKDILTALCIIFLKLVNQELSRSAPPALNVRGKHWAAIVNGQDMSSKF